MKFIKILFLALILVESTSLPAQEIKNWTLEECVNYAYENNLSIERTELSLESEEVTLKQNRLSRIPSLNASIFNSWRWGRSIDPTSNRLPPTASTQMVLVPVLNIRYTVERLRLRRGAGGRRRTETADHRSVGRW